MSPVVAWQAATSGQSRQARAKASVGMRPRFSSFTVTKREEPEADLRRVEQRRVAADHAGLLQRAHAPQARAGRERHAPGELQVGDAPVLLQQVEELAVGLVRAWAWPYRCVGVIWSAILLREAGVTARHLCNPIAAGAAYNPAGSAARPEETRHDRAGPRSTTRWAPTASSSSSTPRPNPELLGALFEQLGFAPSPGTAPRTWRSTGRGASTSS